MTIELKWICDLLLQHLTKDDFILCYAEEGAFSAAQRGGEKKGLASNRSFKTCWFTNPTHTHTPKFDLEGQCN